MSKHDTTPEPATTDGTAGQRRPPATDRPSATETAVPDGAEPAVCDRCGRPFPDAELLALHRGLAHYEALSADEREAYESAYREETADLRVFRLQAMAALVLLYFGFLFAYSVFG